MCSTIATNTELMSALDLLLQEKKFTLKIKTMILALPFSLRVVKGS